VIELPGGYIICEYESVKKEFPEFNAVMESLKSELVSRSSEEWGISSDKFTFEAGHLTTVLPALFSDINGNRLTTWDQWFDATGHQTILTGVGTGGTIPEDFKVAFVGLAFLDKAIRISEIKMQISDKKLPRINIEEAFAYNKPAIIFEEGFILDEETSFDLYAYILTQGPQRIKLIGLQANRVKDKLLTTDVGAAVV
jgi:hypothetical protein